MDSNYYNTKESVDEYIKLAKDVNGAQLIEKLKKILNSGSLVLEMGSGPGSDWKILSGHYRVIGSDNSTEFLNRLIIDNPNGEFVNLDAITLTTDKKFDGIYSNKVLHHLKDKELESSIIRQYKILHHNGIICHSFWKGTGTEIHKGIFVNYHTDSDLKNIFDKYFDILILEEYKEFEDNDSILLIGKKKQQHHNPSSFGFATD